LNTTSRTRTNDGKVYTNRAGKHDKKWGGFDRIFDAITDPIIVFDMEFRLIKINKAAKFFFTGRPIGKKCFLTKHKFALACKNCPTWQTLKTGTATTSEILSPKTSTPLLLKTYPIYNRLKKIKGVVLLGRESNDVPIKWKR
jgi:transcriptional regulator with PAS, ATPase and Fis domain